MLSLVNLHTLDLSYTSFAEQKIIFQENNTPKIIFLEFLKNIKDLPNLKNLNIGNNILFPEVRKASHFGHARSNEAKRLLGLYNTWRKDQIERCALKISQKPTLKKIFMQETGLGDLFINTLNFQGLRELDLSGNHFLPEVAADFCERHRNYLIKVRFSNPKEIEQVIIERFLNNVSLEDELDF